MLQRQKISTARNPTSFTYVENKIVFERLNQRSFVAGRVDFLLLKNLTLEHDGAPQ